jgi:hypothetical protein
MGQAKIGEAESQDPPQSQKLGRKGSGNCAGETGMVKETRKNVPRVWGRGKGHGFLH